MRHAWPTFFLTRSAEFKNALRLYAQVAFAAMFDSLELCARICGDARKTTPPLNLRPPQVRRKIQCARASKSWYYGRSRPWQRRHWACERRDTVICDCESRLGGSTPGGQAQTRREEDRGLLGHSLDLKCGFAITPNVSKRCEVFKSFKSRWSDKRCLENTASNTALMLCRESKYLRHLG